MDTEVLAGEAGSGPPHTPGLCAQMAGNAAKQYDERLLLCLLTGKDTTPGMGRGQQQCPRAVTCTTQQSPYRVRGTGSLVTGWENRLSEGVSYQVRYQRFPPRGAAAKIK